MTEITEMDVRALLLEAIVGGLERVTRLGGACNRLIIQGDQGFVVVRGVCDDEEVEVIAAAGRQLERKLSEAEAQQLYEVGFRRKTAALCWTKSTYLESSADREKIGEEILETTLSIYASKADVVSVHERFGDAYQNANPRVINAMRRLSKDRDMPSRQKVYWAIVRADVLLALDKAPPPSLNKESDRTRWVSAGLADISQVSSSVSLKSFKSITGYRSASIFTDPEALELIDPRGVNAILVPGRLALMLALEQGWDSLLINPRSEVGGELYRNELQSIHDGLKQLGW
jgi:hypothetical protein